MGPLRRGVVLACLPSAAMAEVCDKARPNWDGTPVTALDEAMFLLSTPASLVLILASLICVRFKLQWPALIVVVLWTALISVVAFVPDLPGMDAAARLEGCIGPPGLFIAAVAAICVGMIVYTAPRLGRD